MSTIIYYYLFLRDRLLDFLNSTTILKPELHRSAPESLEKYLPFDTSLMIILSDEGRFPTSFIFNSAKLTSIY